jgi:hypothetical protein
LVTMGVFAELVVQLGRQSQVDRFPSHARTIRSGPRVAPRGVELIRRLGAKLAHDKSRRRGPSWPRPSLKLPCPSVGRRSPARVLPGPQARLTACGPGGIRAALGCRPSGWGASPLPRERPPRSGRRRPSFTCPADAR